MAEITKTLFSAVPTIDTATGFVRSWYIKIRMSDNEAVPYEKEFEFPVTIRNPSKTPSE